MATLQFLFKGKNMNPVPDHQDPGQGDENHREKERAQNSSGLTGHFYLGMRLNRRTPEFYTQEDDWDIHEGDDPQNRRIAGDPFRMSAKFPEHKIADVSEEQDQRGCQSWFPDPGFAPDWSCPDRSGRENQGREQGAQFGTDFPESIPFGIPFDQIQDSENHHTEIGQKSRPGDGNMKIKNLLRPMLRWYHRSVGGDNIEVQDVKQDDPAQPDLV